ncbi:MAG: poly-beta-1,6-N-acetyl-D-glucosamine N-deacetylase PgaB [Gammaproteobacteria bacterium]|nr:poly-beta-1,6-N-acetyl-D-glucosamine N-deacetylase PgaB [Gammaproteobacteria bacterium]
MAILRWLPVLVLFFATPVPGMEHSFHVIAYHDVRDDVAGDYDPDQFAVSTANLIDQFTWMRDNGFIPVSMDQILDARAGGKPLPDNAVLLTFDDGLRSVYTRVYPLLRLFEYPAVVSVVTSWIESDVTVVYADEKLRRDDFLTWAQIREMQESGLVEIASHTHDMHKGIRGNPQGNQQPAAQTRLFDGERYENEQEFLQRIDDDLRESVQIIRENTERVPRIITWPYGAYNELSASVARDVGLTINMTLDPASVDQGDSVRLGRSLMIANPGLTYFSLEISSEPVRPIVRVAQVDLDYVYDPDPKRQNYNLGLLLDRIKALEISHVYLQAFVDTDADGGASAVYFPNRHLPVRADLFNHVAWQLKTRAQVAVYAWLPLLSYVGGPFDPEWRVLEFRDGEFAPDPDSEPRLTPFSADVRKHIAEIYEDLSIYAHFDGILFHDDGRLSDMEDYSEIALEHYREVLGVEISPELVASDQELNYRWAGLKAQKMREFSLDLVEVVKTYHPELKSVRNIFASALLDEWGTSFLAQDYDEYLESYDFVALMAMPSLEGADNEKRFYVDLVDQVSRREHGLDRTVFELQSYDWRKSRPIPGDELRETMRWLQSLGVRNLGYYPDDFITGKPDFDQLRRGISLATDLVGENR